MLDGLFDAVVIILMECVLACPCDGVYMSDDARVRQSVELVIMFMVCWSATAEYYSRYNDNLSCVTIPMMDAWRVVNIVESVLSVTRSQRKYQNLIRQALY